MAQATYKVTFPNVGRPLEAPKFWVKVKADDEESAKREGIRFFEADLALRGFSDYSLYLVRTMSYSLIEIEELISKQEATEISKRAIERARRNRRNSNYR